MIDWFTVVAQIINFLILVGLLRYFLYDRVLAAMDKRQQEIASRWDESQQQREQAERELELAREKNDQLDHHREQLLADVRDEVEQHRQQMTAKVRVEVDELQARWSTAIQEETESFLRDLRRRASEEVCAIARKALADLATANLERQVVERFLERLGQLDDGRRQAVVESLRHGGHVVIVQTTSELADDQRESIESVLRERFRADLDVRFELSEDLLCGIALQTNSHKLAWDLRDYLISFEQEVQQALDEEAAASMSRRTAAATKE